MAAVEMDTNTKKRKVAGLANTEPAPTQEPTAATAAAAAAGQPGEAPPDAPPKKRGKSAPVLPWMRVPVTIDPADGVPLEEVHGLDPRLAAALGATGVEVLFPVQAVAWRETAGGSSPSHDLCIAAPTGSGKTLAYVLPLLQALSRRCVPLLRALVVLPTRDLALQVLAVLRALCPALGLTACAACGQGSLLAEARSLTEGSTRADVVVATPGRLMAHLEGTRGFTLGHLKFLVVDETDRLLRQGYQGWLPRVLAAAGGEAGVGGERRVVKFVVSATLTRDPSKIDRLHLHCPRYIAMTTPDDHRYKLPPGLHESKLVVGAEHKPTALVALLASVKGLPTIVFTSSVESTHRLAVMLRVLGPTVGNAVEYSAAVPPERRHAALRAFRAGEASVLVCSDAMTRGMDVEGVGVVINYDAPVYVKTYVHRAGRTARAGRGGRVITLLRHEDVRHFKDMLRKADNTYVKDEKLGEGALAAVRAEVVAAVGQMAVALEGEAQHQQGGAALGAGTESKAVAGEQGSDKGQRKPKAKRRKVAGVPELRLL